jgi:hypothetical protein
VQKNDVVEQWFSTFLSLQHSNFDFKICGATKCKEDQNDKNEAFCILSLKFSDLEAHQNIGRHTG